MSWNPRRMVMVMRKVWPTTAPLNSDLLWLSDDALLRALSALDNPGSVVFTAEPVGRDGLTVGLSTSMPCQHGDELAILELPSMRSVAEDVVAAGHTPADAVKYVSHAGVLGMVCYHRDLSTCGVCVVERTAPVEGDSVYDMRSSWRALPDEKMDSMRLFGTQAEMISLFPAEYAQRVIDVMRTAWTWRCEPVERDASATTVADTEVPPDSKGGKSKRARKSGIGARSVAVIDVRRRTAPRQPTATGRVVEHDHRWTVRGHWRMQPFGPGREQRRRIWIDSHIAGPDDKPLRDRPRVYRV